jgi:hypothetical protein
MNILNLTVRAAVCAAFVSVSFAQDSDDALKKHPAKDAAGFEWIFDGKDVAKYKTEGNWQKQDDGSLKLTPREGESGWTRYNHYIWLPGEYGDFTFDFEFQYTKGGNSGLYFRCADDVDPTKSGFEVQIMDSYGAKKELGHHDMGGVIQTGGPSKNMSKPAGEWNQMTVSMKGDRLIVVLNGECIQDMNLQEKKPKDKDLAKSGKIAIQDHGLPFSVRNLRVKKG